METTGVLPPTPDVVATLVAGHRKFLAFLETRVRNRAVAEEILQAAFVKGLEKAGTLRDSESAVAWFYRLLRNALTDHYRRNATEGRALEHLAREADESVEPEVKDALCACMGTLLPTLKPEYAEMVRRVDLQETPVSDVARDLGISPNNAMVRLHRARLALRHALERSCGTCTTHGCLDCHCGGGAAGQGRPEPVGKG